MTIPFEHYLTVNGGKLAVFEWPGKGPPLFFVHATGFHARCWNQVIAQLSGHHCYAIDMRGHGRSHKPSPPYHWRSFAEDLAALGTMLNLDGAFGIGHSMGGHSLALATALSPDLFAKLLLLDPTILTKSLYTGRALEQTHFATRRRNLWSSADEMYQRFKDRNPFARWNSAVLRDYCDYGLLPNENGEGLMLACPPIIEGAIYNHSTETDIYDQIATIKIPVQIVRAGGISADHSEGRAANAPDMSLSPTAPDLANHFSQAQDLCLTGVSHFIPMEDPILVARLIKQIIETEI